MVYEIRWRKGESGIWAARNPVLALGEPGYETDTKKFKIGDGQTRWLLLPYFINQTGIESLIDAAAVEGPPGPGGKSAYEVAVDNGFSGTESQWLASLVGSQGPPGQDGADGAQGIQGVPGTDGQDGEDGTPGAPGADGEDGAPGSDGESVTVTLVDAADWPPPADSNPLHLYFRVP